MPQTGALGLLATLAAMEITVPKRVELGRTQFQISVDMLANGRSSYKEQGLLMGEILSDKDRKSRPGGWGSIEIV